MSTSIPVAVRVQWSVGADLGCSNRGAASRFSAGKAATSRGSVIGQVSISTSRQDRRAL
jgi:hypothetical protein